MADRSVLDWITVVLVIIAGLDIGLSSVNFDLLGVLPAGGLTTTVSALIGLSTLYMIYGLTQE